LNIAVIGQGYVGLPLAIAASSAGHKVIGVEVNPDRVASLNAGHSPIGDISSSDIQNRIGAKAYRATTDFSEVAKCEVILICVPTPIDQDSKPDLEPLRKAVISLAPYVSSGTLMILESTVGPGSTRAVLHDLFLKHSTLSSDQIDIAFSPERIDPANQTWNVINTPKLVAGLTEAAKKRATDFYKTFVDEVHAFDSLEVVETAKLLENTFRLINISFINEIADFCEKLGIKVEDVILAAKTKPYGFMPFYPSVGIGGHCIPVDPLYLADKAREIGAEYSFIELAHTINEKRPLHFADLAQNKLGTLTDKKILVVGVAYKPNVSDVRETPVLALIDSLRSKGADVCWNDDLVKNWRGETSEPISPNFDLAILANVHDGAEIESLGSVPVIDSRVEVK